MGLNEIIIEQLKTDRNPLMKTIADKVAFRDWVEEKGYQCIPLADEQDDSFVAKASNDSGSAVVVVDGYIKSGTIQRLHKHRYVPYGVNKGEWFYEGIPFQIIKEKYMGNLIDYKFHCMKGKVAAVQIIGDRHRKTRECIRLPDGELQKWILDEKFPYKYYPMPDNWKEMVKVAEDLSSEFNYVRVDLYSIKGEIYVGELTFAPRAGKYPGEGQKLLGELCEDTNLSKLPPSRGCVE